MRPPTSPTTVPDPFSSPAPVAPSAGAWPPAIDPSPLWRSQRGAAALLLGVFSYLFLINSWVGDDAYISFRVVDNLVHGYGLTYNPPERVQVFTHPLWLLLHVPAYLVTGEPFYTTLVLSYLCGAAALLVVLRRLGIARGALAAALAFSSKAWVDYTSSGLENPLSYLILALFFTRLFVLVERGREPEADDVQAFALLAALGFVNRIDAVLLLGPPMAWIVARSLRVSPLLPIVRACAIGSLPAVVWELFAIVYYGFALPNTYYAKVATGLPASLLVGQGLSYAVNSLAFDPLTLLTPALVAALAVVLRTPALRVTALGLASSVAYTVWVGGDHMGSRFFTPPFFVAALAVAWTAQSRPTALGLAVLLALYNLANPLAPIKSGPDYQQAWAWRDANGIQDERGYYHRATSLLLYNPIGDRPDHEWFRQGLSFARGAERVTVQGSIGFLGFAAGPERYVIDQNALSDPLLARLPVSDQVYADFYVGHYMRDIPAGYLESWGDGQNHLVDPALHAFYERLRRVTRGPLFSLARMADIWRLNTGAAGRLHADYDRARATRITFPGTHPRLRTDIGVRDYTRAEMRSPGARAGYLQYGPHVPLRAGHYEVRWVGAAGELPPIDTVAEVEVLVDGRELRTQPMPRPSSTAEGLLATLSFDLAEPARDVEVRLFVDTGVHLALQRLEITGTPPAP